MCEKALLFVNVCVRAHALACLDECVCVLVCPAFVYIVYAPRVRACL